MYHRPFIVLLALAGSGYCAQAAEPELVWSADGFAGPESIVHDAQRDMFYVSNMGTWGQGEVPHDGFISLVAADGTIRQLRWITGLDNPKGLAMANGRLYVGDDNAMIEIDPAVGKIIARHAPADGEPAGFNDCTADPEGNVYVFSPRLRSVFRLSGGKFEPWVELDFSRTPGPNGLRAETDRLLLGGWSFRNAAGEEEVGHIATVRYADKQFGRIGTTPVCHVDGIEPDGLGGYTVTDWLTGEVLRVSAGGGVTPLLQLPPGTADHEYLIERGLLLIPLMKDNEVRAYRWTPSQD